MSYRIQSPTIQKRNLKGLTLVELVIVISIVGILASIVSISLGDQRTKKELEANAREFASVLKEAQNYALTGKQAGSGVTCQFDVVWPTVSAYRIEAQAKSGDTCTGASTTIADYSLKQGVVFSTTSGVSFALPWAESSSATIQFDKLDIHHTVCLNASGAITDHAGSGCP
ncbi:MAG: prepilin-type N-terminal cleavage/methylation domain-containing protein [Candidatus Moraniibacteriota bacterium]